MMPANTLSRLHRLCGVWRLERSITEGNRGSGVARIDRLSDSTCRLEEFVTIMVSNRERVSGRRRFLLEEEHERLIFRFDDGLNVGEVFQTFAAGGVPSNSTHQCGKDVYESTWIWVSDDEFELRHTVNGPKKSYEMRTRYLRAERQI